MFWRGLIGYLPVQIVQGVVGLLGIVVFTRLLTPAQYGAYALGFSAMSLAHTLCFTWVEAAMARFYQAESRPSGQISNHFATLYRSWFAMALVYPIVCSLALWLWPMAHDVKLAMAAGLATVMFRSLAKLAQERRRAAGQVRSVALLDITQTAGGFAAGAGLIVLGFGGAAPLAGVGVIAAICLAFVLPTELRFAHGGQFQRDRALLYLNYGLPVAASLILALVLATTDRFLLAAFLNEEAVGIYHAGYSLANRTLDVMFIWLGMAGAPAMIAALERGGPKALASVAEEQGSLMVAIAVPAAVGLALVARPLADVMVGPALSAGAGQVTPWIAASAAFAGLTTYYFHQAFTLGRQTKLLLAAMSIPALVNLGLTLVLIPVYGLNGALWATAASYGVGMLSSYYLGRRVLPLPVPWNSLLQACLATALMAAIVVMLPSMGGFAELGLKSAAGGLVYGLAAAVLNIGGLRSRALELLLARRSGAPA